MEISNRNRRLREFVLWFEYKYGLNQSNIKTVGVNRVIDQTLLLETYLAQKLPVCYWCRKVVTSSSISVDEDDVTLHHIDEDRSHNTVDNLDICHKTCHQLMHKLSQINNIPSAMLWILHHGEYKTSVIKNLEIVGVGR